MRFPQSFIDELRAQADIVQVIQDYVPLKRAGGSYKGLCPFHSEKTPSFNVNGEKGFFHCFGCGVGGDVFKFLELHDQLGFQEAVRQLAGRFGVPVPAMEDAGSDPNADADREALLKIHEMAALHFREQLAGSSGAQARKFLQQRNLTGDTIEKLGLGYAPHARTTLKSHLLAQGFPLLLIIRSGLVTEREQGDVVDRFRNRLIIPICRDSGSVVAFGGRAMGTGQQPKYLNSPETAIYSKSRILYGLNITKSDIRRLGYAVLVEGYFDFAQALQAGVAAVVASCGTALTSAQAHLLHRFAGKVVLSFDPDTAGQSAAARSCELLVSEGLKVNVAMLPAGEDPDTFIRRHGGPAYMDKLRTSQPYLEYLLDRAAESHDLASDDSRRDFLTKMLAVAAWIPDAAARDQFGDRLAHKARIHEEVVRAEIRKAAVARRTTLTSRELPGFGHVKQAEKGLIWAIVHQPAAGLAALRELEEADIEGLAAGTILSTARGMQRLAVENLPAALLERLSTVDAQLVAAIASEQDAPAPPVECARAVKRLRYERERALIQHEIDELQERGHSDSDKRIDMLWERKKDLLHRIEALGT